MRLISFENFRLNENLTPDEIKKQHKIEKKFVRKMEELSKDILSEEESDIEHPVFDKLGELILNIYDRNFFTKANSKEGLDEKDYKEALSELKDKITKYKESAGGKKAIERYLKRKEKEENTSENYNMYYIAKFENWNAGTEDYDLIASKKLFDELVKNGAFEVNKDTAPIYKEILTNMLGNGIVDYDTEVNRDEFDKVTDTFDFYFLTEKGKEEIKEPNDILDYIIA